MKVMLVCLKVRLGRNPVGLDLLPLRDHKTIGYGEQQVLVLKASAFDVSLTCNLSPFSRAL